MSLIFITGAPEVLGRAVGTTATAVLSAGHIGPGPWFVFAALAGPFPPEGAPGTTADFTTVARTKAFDPTVTSSTGDVWLSSVEPDPPPFTPRVLRPRETGTITVTITPDAPAGTVVTGVLHVDDFSEFAETGDELRAIPYAYTVG